MSESGLYKAEYLALVKKKMALDSHKQMKLPRSFLAQYKKKIKFEPCLLPSPPLHQFLLHCTGSDYAESHTHTANKAKNCPKTCSYEVKGGE